MVIKLEFVDFVVSDSPTAYPDGGEQGGYWYEKVVEGIAEGVDCGFFTPTNNMKTITFAHNLQQIPNNIRIIAMSSVNSYSASSTYFVAAYSSAGLGSYYNNTCNCNVVGFSYYDSTPNGDGNITAEKNIYTVTLSTENSSKTYYFKGGIKYLYILD